MLEPSKEGLTSLHHIPCTCGSTNLRTHRRTNGLVEANELSSLNVALGLVDAKLLAADVDRGKKYAPAEL